MGPHVGYLLSKMPCLVFSPCAETSNPSTALRQKDDSWKASGSEVYLRRGEEDMAQHLLSPFTDRWVKLCEILLMALSGGDPGHFITLSLNL